TASSGQRWELRSSSGTPNIINGFSGVSSELSPGKIEVGSWDSGYSSSAGIYITAPVIMPNTVNPTPRIAMHSEDAYNDGTIWITADKTHISGYKGIYISGDTLVQADLGVVGSLNLSMLRFGIGSRYIAYNTSKSSAARGQEVGAGSLSRVTGNGTLGAHPVTISGENLVIVETGLYTIDYTVNLPGTFRPTGSTRAYIAISAWNYTYRA